MSVFFTDTDCEMWFTDAEKLGMHVIGMPYTIDDYKQYVFYLFNKGEFMESIEENDLKTALKEYSKIYKLKDYDLLIQYDKKNDDYLIIRNTQLKK